MKKYFAVVRWMIEDVKALRPEWTDEQCRVWWEKNEKSFSDILTEHGNECLSQMLGEVNA